MTTISPSDELPGWARPVSDVAASAVVGVDASESLDQVFRRLAVAHVGAVPVWDGGELVGVLSERDLVRAVGLGAEPDRVLASEVSSRELVWCEPATSIGAAAMRMSEYGTRHLLVGDGETLSGIVSSRDLLVAFVARPSTPGVR